MLPIIDSHEMRRAEITIIMYLTDYCAKNSNS